MAGVDLLVQYALTLVGRPYHWGGDDPLSGFDCSGFVEEILKAAGRIPRLSPKMSAQEIYNHLMSTGEEAGESKAGSIAFFGKDLNHIDHIGFCVTPFQMIHAGSGDSTTVSDERASQQNAFVRLDLISYRKDFLRVIWPGYPALGVV